MTLTFDQMRLTIGPWTLAIVDLWSYDLDLWPWYLGYDFLGKNLGVWFFGYDFIGMTFWL